MHIFNLPQITCLLSIFKNAALIDVHTALGLVAHLWSRVRTLLGPSQSQHAPHLPHALRVKESLAASQGNLIV